MSGHARELEAYVARVAQGGAVAGVACSAATAAEWREALLGTLPGDLDRVFRLKAGLQTGEDGVGPWLNEVGKKLWKTGAKLGAAAAFALAEVADPTFASAPFNRGRLCAEVGDLKGAEGHYRRVLARHPGHVGALCNLGNMRGRAGDREAAKELLQRALALKPDQPTVRKNLDELESIKGPAWQIEQDRGRVAFDGEDHWKAIECFRRAMELGAPRGRMLLAMAQAALHAHDFTKALEWSDAAAVEMPKDAGPAWIRTHTLLATGDWEAGWESWRSRWRPRWPVKVSSNSKNWAGETGPEVRLRVIVEQAAGDTMMCARLLPWVRSRVGAVALELPPRLHRILSPVLEGVAVEPLNLSTPSVKTADDDWRATHHVALSDLPAWHGWPPETMGSWTPVGDKNTAGAREVIDAYLRYGRSSLTTGIAWQGNRGYGDDVRRSPGLAVLRPLADVRGVGLVSMQHGDGREELVDWPTLLDAGARLDMGKDGFVETAAVLGALGLLITSDSALAHLAGAMGRPVWLLLSHTPDWRWGVAGTSTGWYPTMKLYRQKLAGDWASVVAEVVKDLTEMARQRW